MKYKIKQIITVIFLSASVLFGASALAASDCVVDTSIRHQTIRGFGGINHPEWNPGGDLTEEERQTAFGNGENELGLNILRIYINDDRELWYKAVPTAKAAAEKGAIIFASPWDPPADMRDIVMDNNGNPVLNWKGEKQRHLRRDKYAEYAAHLNDFVTYMKENGVEIYALSIQNEPDCNGEEWAMWTPEECVDFLANYADKIDCRIISPESYQYNKNYYTSILNNAKAFENTDIFGTHVYKVPRQDMDFPLLEQCGKEIWMTEVYVPNSSSDADTWPEAIAVSENIHDCFTVGNMNSYVWWYLRRYYGPIKEDGAISKRGYCMAQYSKYVLPGYVRIDSTESPASNVHISAYKGDENKVVIVAVNNSDSGYAQNFWLNNEKIKNIVRYRTTDTDNLAETASGFEQYYNTDRFSSWLPERSVSTLVLTLESKNEVEFNYAKPIETRIGVAPVMPSSVTVDGVTFNNITWNKVDTSLAGTFNVTGTASNSETEVTITATVTVLEKSYNDYLTHHYEFSDLKNSVTGEEGIELFGNAKLNNNKLLLPDGERTSHAKIIGDVIAEGQDEITVSVWFRTSRYTSKDKGVFGFGTGFDASANRLFYDPDVGGAQKFAIRVGSHEDVYKFGSFTSPEQWNQFILTIDRNNVVTIYYNGDKYSTLMPNGVSSVRGANNFIGTSGYFVGEHGSIMGYIDDFRIYNVALTEDEVAQLRMEGKPDECNELISYTQPSLGVDEDNNFYIKYKVDFSDAIKSNTSIVNCHVAIQYLTGGNFVNQITDKAVNVDENGIATVGIRPEDTNVIYNIRAFTKIGNDTYTTETIGGTATSVYEEVVKALANGGYTADSRLNQVLVEKANEVISKGGVLSADIPDDVRSKIMTAAKNEDGTITVAINEPFASLGLGFIYNDSLYVGSEETNYVVGEGDNKVYTELTINIDEGKVTFANTETMEAEVIYLDAVQLEFIQEIIEEIVEDQVFEIESGSFEDIM